MVWIVISFSLVRNYASPFFVDSFSILSFSKAWNTTGIFSSKKPVFPVYPIQLVCVGSFRQWFLVLCLFRSANEFPGFTLPVYMSKHTDRIISFSSDCFFCFILTEAQCTAVNMLLCFRSHWPHPLSFLVALSAAAIFRFVVPPWSFQDLQPPNLNSRSYRLSFRCNFSAFCLLRFSTFGFTGYTFCDAGFLLDPVFLSSSFMSTERPNRDPKCCLKEFP